VLAITVIGLLALTLGLVLGFAADRFMVTGNPVVEQINDLLPQTQCGQCNFPGCRPYAEAIASGQADINHCPPGGKATIQALADLLDRDVRSLDPVNGEEAPTAVAVIDENLCIGCTICIQACPVDAIVGASKQMHTVIEAECTGCDLCVEPCPVDCIDMVVPALQLGDWKWPSPARWISRTG